MIDFEYAQPRTETEALELLSSEPGHTLVHAGGTDLVPLLKKMIESPQRVVHVGEIPEWKTIEVAGDEAIWIGAAVTLREALAAADLDPYPAVKQLIQESGSLQVQTQTTLGGELLTRPRCWYFRDGQGLLADRGRSVMHGDNRYHAILGNRGPAKFVSASRLAPALISLNAKARLRRAAGDEERIVPLESLYRAPRDESERENTLRPDEVLTHIILPPDQGLLSAAYEVRQGAAPGAPLTAAAAALNVVAGVVREARIVMGQVAPIPWISDQASQAIVGKPLNAETADYAGRQATTGAMALSENEYKIQLAQVAVKRSILRAAGLHTGGF